MISVIIPAYNCEKTLERAVRSLLCQTYTDYEIVIVNDGSTDGTEEVARQMASLDDRVRFFTVPNGGAADARNKGIDEARGEYLCFVDSDDYVSPEFLESLISNAGEGVLPCVGFSKDGSQTSVLSDLPGGEYTINGDPADDLLHGQLETGIAYSVCNKLFCTDDLNKRSIRFFGGYKVGEDLLFTMRYICCCDKVIADNRALYHYCYNEDSAIRSAANNLLPSYEQLLGKLAELRENGCPLSDDALRAWAFDSIIVALCNGYTLTLTAEEFAEYCKGSLFCSPMYKSAMEYRDKVGFQRSVFRLALRHKNISLLHALIKGKRSLNGAP